MRETEWGRNREERERVPSLELPGGESEAIVDRRVEREEWELGRFRRFSVKRDDLGGTSLDYGAIISLGF